MNVYPYSSPIILNDIIFVNNGGQTGTSNAAMRNAAYLIAEQQATNYVGSFLLPTVVTGTYPVTSRVMTDYGYVSEVKSVVLFSRTPAIEQCVLSPYPGCAFVWEDTYGYLDMNFIMNRCGCNSDIPYQIQVAYQAGLPTGVASQPAFLLALTMVAQINLNEMVYPSQNEGTGDIGIEEFSSLQYREKRVKMGRTAFGSSAKAYKAAQLIRSTVPLARPSLVL